MKTRTEFRGYFAQASGWRAVCSQVCAPGYSLEPVERGLGFGRPHAQLGLLTWGGARGPCRGFCLSYCVCFLSVQPVPVNPWSLGLGKNNIYSSVSHYPNAVTIYKVSQPDIIAV